MKKGESIEDIHSTFGVLLQLGLLEVVPIPDSSGGTLVRRTATGEGALTDLGDEPIYQAHLAAARTWVYPIAACFVSGVRLSDLPEFLSHPSSKIRDAASRRLEELEAPRGGCMGE